MYQLDEADDSYEELLGGGRLFFILLSPLASKVSE